MENYVETKINELRTEYSQIVETMRNLSAEYDKLEKRKTEIEGAFKSLMEIKNQINPQDADTAEGENADDSQDKSE